MLSRVIVSLILCAFLFENIHGKGTFTLPIHAHQHRSQQRLLPRGRAGNDENSGVIASQPLHAGRTGADEMFQFNVAIGSPAQSMNLTIDVIRIPTFLFGAGERERNCYKVASTRHYFKPNASKTFADSGESHQYPFAGYTECSYDISDGATDVTDTITIGNVTVEKYPLVFTPKSSKYLDPEWPSDGVFGLANGYAMFNLLLNFDIDKISLYYKRGQTTSVSEPAGAITIGGPDLHNCESDWYYVFTAADRGWSFGTDSFSFGSASFNDGYYAYLSSYTSYIWTPTKYFQKIVSVIGAEYDHPHDQYLVDCANIPTFPDMVFQITVYNQKPYEYRIPAVDYVRKIDPSMNKCTLMLMESDLTYLDSPYWDLGTTFHRPQCIMFNYFFNGIAFSKAKQ